MAGENAPSAWQGGLNFTYKLGPGFTQPGRKVQMFISTSNQNASIYNVFGIIKGSIEPGTKISSNKWKSCINIRYTEVYA